MAKKIDELKKRYPNITNDIIELQGKPFVTYEGLLNEAHRKGLTAIDTELIQFPAEDNKNTCIFKAIVVGNDKTFTGYGDATPTNVNRNIAKHLIRMAETRAKARALRDFTNIGITSSDEIDFDDFKDTKTTKNTSATNSSKVEVTNKPITKKQHEELTNLYKENKDLFTDVCGALDINVTKIRELDSKQASELIDAVYETKKSIKK